MLLFRPVIVRIIPKASTFLLRPILRSFGFGCRGPVKGWLATWIMNVVDLSEYIIILLLLLGSIAARAQSLFFGAKVPKGSLFAWLQSVGMKKRGGIPRHLEVLLAF